jgi:PTS system ascorbate-specific IIC component
VALLGLILQRKSVTAVILGTVKTILGFLILSVGIGATLGGLRNFDSLFTAAFGVTGVYFDDNIAVGAVMGQVGQEVGLVMVFGFLANVLFARITKAKWIYLTGHKVWHMAGGIALVLFTFGLSGVLLVVLGALILGLYMVLQPAIIQPYTRQVTGSDDYGVGHTMGSVYWVSGIVGKLVGNKERKIDELSLPTGLEAFRDIAVAFSLIMFVMFAVPSIFAGAKAAELAGSQHPVVWIVIQSLTSAGGILVILQGVRMFIGELIPAFRGIAEKLVPGAAPALDCPVVFPFSPTGVVVGLITGFIGWLIGMGICAAVRLPIIPVPSMIAIMFGCTAGAVYGNATGGARGAVAAGLVTGILWPIAGALFHPIIPWDQYGVTGAALMTPDIYIVVTIIKAIGSLIGLVF